MDTFSAALSSSEVAPRFFVPGTKATKVAETRYEELRAAAREQVEAPPRDRRIFNIGCRYEGHDCTIEVGGVSPRDGRKVLAIFDHGSHAGYTVSTEAGEAELQLDRHVYWVTEFA
jgi:hypothetical protein